MLLFVKLTMEIFELCFVYGRLVPAFAALSIRSFSEISFCFFGCVIGLICDQTRAQNQTASSCLTLHIHYIWQIVHWDPVHRYPFHWKYFPRSSLVPLPSLLMMILFIYMEDKDQITDLNNTGNWPREYTFDDTGLGTGKIRPQEDSIRLLKYPTWTMAGRLVQTVKNMPVDICTDRGEGAEHRRKQRR